MNHVDIVGTSYTRQLIFSESQPSAHRIACGAIADYEDMAAIKIHEIIELHTPDIFHPYLSGLISAHESWPGVKILMQGENKEIIDSVKFPREFVTSLADAYPHAYWTSTISWMISYVLAQAQEKIHLHIFGVEVAADSEYTYERPCIEFWLGVAESAGHTVTVHGASSLFAHTYEYGYDHVPAATAETLKAYKELLQGQDTTNRKIAQALLQAGAKLDEVIPEASAIAQELLNTQKEQAGAVKAIERLLTRLR